MEQELTTFYSTNYLNVQYNITGHTANKGYYSYQAIKSSGNYFGTIELFIESNILWTDELLNVRSEDYVAVNDTFIEVASKFMAKTNLHSYLYEFGKVQFIEFSSGLVSAFVDVSIEKYFNRFHVDSLLGVHFFNGTNGFVFEIQRTNKTGPFPHAIEYSAAVFNDNTIQINITNPEIINRRYHKGYFLRASLYYVYNDEWYHDEERTFYTGKNSFLYSHLTTYRWHHITVHALSHEGCSPSSNVTIIETPPSVNMKGPSFHNAYAQDNGIMLQWNHYPWWEWNAPHLYSYGVLYKPSNDINADNISTYDFVNISSSVTSFLLPDLEIYTEYNLYIGTTNDIGFGGLSNMRSVRTNPGPPEVAPNMTSIQLVDTTRVRFAWNPFPNDIELYNAPSMSNYVIKINPIHPSLTSAECQHFEDFTGPSAMSYELPTHCDPWHTFKVSIAIRNSAGYTGVENVYCYTLGRMAPGKLLVLNATIGNSLPDDLTSINITVGEVLVEQENTIITHYEVSYKSLDWEDDWKVVNVSIGHTEEFRNSLQDEKQYNMTCPDLIHSNSSANMTMPHSSHRVNYTLPALYYANYTIVARACGEEGCSALNISTRIRTDEHTPFCPPPNITLFNTSSTSLKVTFEEMSHACLSGQLQFYGLLLFETEEYAEFNLLTFDALKERAMYNETMETEFEFNNLNEYWKYTVVAFAQNNGGRGVLSKPVNAFTAEAAPDGVPQHCSVWHYNSSAIVLSVGKPERLLMNGLIHYEVVVRNQFGDEITRTLELDGDITTTVFSNLTKFMYHNISIRAATVKGPGPEFMIYNRTLEDVPSLPPDNFAVHNVTNDTIIITWTDIPPLSVHGELQTYYVSGCGLLRNDTWHCVSKHVTSYSAKFTLFPGTMYRFTLSGCTNVGCGAETYLEQSSLEMVPSGTANNITADAITTNSINITWTSVKPMEKRGDVIFYNVSLINIPHYWQSSSDIDKLFLIRNQTLLQNGVMSLLFDDLDNHTSYRVSITAYTAIGAGLTSEEVIYTTRQNLPSAYPENVTAFDTSSSSLNVSWLPLHPSDHEGILLGYNISYSVSEGFTDIRGGNTSGFLLCIGGDKSSCELTGLSLNTPFDILVAGYTIRGVGPLSIMINGTTGEYVDGNWTSWTQWGSCSKSCGLGAEMRQRWCVEPEPEFGGNYCPGSAREYRDCHNFTCPGYYLANPGASCTETCRSLGSDFDCALNMNFQNKTSVFTSAIEVSDFTKLVNINCNTSAETISYQTSVHPSYDINNGMCIGYSNIPLKIDCDAKSDEATRRLCRCLDNESTQYTEWANWGMCSKECGTGVYQRFRECIMANGCTGTDRAREDCNIDPCPVHGQWSQWSELSNCTKSCGFGDRLRTRTCTDPAPKYGGKDCEGNVDTEAFEGCNPMPCPRHGQWGAWHNVSECKHSCGDQGFKIQMRYCNNPSPLYGGNDCVGENNKTYPCEGNKPCMPAKYMFNVRFIDELWEYPMYRLANNRSVNLSRRIDNELRKFYGSSILSQITDDLVIEFHKMSKGSVIVLFSIEYQAVPHIESLILQHTIEGGMLNHMPVGLKHISVPTLPNGAPHTVKAESNSPYTIDVSWSSINMSIVNGNFFLYQVFFTKLDVDTEEWDNFGTTNTSYTLIDLEPGALYGIRVLAATENGNGVASELIKIRTVEGVPYIKPPSCTYIIMNERTVYFSWDAIPPSQVPGVLRGYEIKFRKYHKEKEDFAIADETMSQKTVFGFKPYTWYWVEVAGFTNAVERVGPHEVFVFRMPPGAPEIAPPNATAHSHYSTTEMLVTWDFIPKEDENGYLNGYRLYYRKYQQGGLDTVGEPFIVVTLDRFTKSYMMKGLESYTQYEITIYGYSAYGDGPSAVIYGETCKCPKYIFNNWYERKPYVEQVTPDTAEGLFPELLTMVLNGVCMQCKSYLPTMYYNKTRDGRTSKKRNVELVKKFIDENVHQSFPIFGRFELTRFGGVHPFIGIIQSQGSAMLVYQPKYNTVGFGTILSSVAAAWPVILIAVLLATMAGWVFWFLEQTAEESDLTQNRSIYGAFEGFWMCFITMTTLGYGDYVPAANISKAAMIFWILMGLCIVSIFGGAVSSGMSVGALATEYKLYGSTVAAVKNSFEFRTAILRNGIVDKQVNYTSILDVINAVSNRSVEIGLVDAISTQGYEKELEAKQVRIYKILDLNSGYGVVLSGELARIENDMRSFVSSNQAKISMFIEKKIGILQPAILDVEELLLTPEESQSMLTKLLIAYVAMAFIGIVAWFLIVVRPKYAKVSPQDQIRSQQVDLQTCHEVVEKFKNDFTERMEQLEELHINERVELNDLKRNYAMHVRRGDIKPVPEQTEKKKKKKRRVPIESSA